MSAKDRYDGTYLDFAKQPGQTRLAESGLGWKPKEGESLTLGKELMTNAFWNRAARGFELKVYTRDDRTIQIDGFKEENLEPIQRAFKNWYSVPFDTKEHSLRGWNWGKTEFGKHELSFNVQSRSAFEIPYSEILTTNLPAKNEVAVEFSLPAENEETSGKDFSGPYPKGKKFGAASDQLMEMRFYIPGVSTVSKKDRKEEKESGSDADEEDEEEINSAQVFYDTLLEKAEIGDVAGVTLATFLDVLHLTPRGRFDIDMYKTSFRLRGKTYDYKIQYDHIKKFMLLPKPDEQHMLITIGLDPPLRQGQTKYPFAVMQVKKEEDVTLDLNMSAEDFQQDYQGKLQQHYEAPIHNVIAALFRGLSGKKVTTPSNDFNSHHGQAGVKCSIKANEGHLFMLDRSFMFVPKPATYVTFDNIERIVMSRVGGAMAASRTFDITIQTRDDSASFQFSNINREEQQPLEEFFRIKNLKVKNEMQDESAGLIAQALADEALDSSDGEAAPARGSADEDDESVDEDFKTDSESDVAEEYDSAHESSGDDSDAEMPDADADEPPAPSEKDIVERPKKKVKTAK
ncbi:FACT complex subunit pob3 [Venturia nashicola]|nr:FACT complex subunit pob3 [Venturia nashicola]